MRAILAYTDDGMLAKGSGYQQLARFMQDTLTLVEARKDPCTFGRRTLVRIMRRLAFSRWCSGGSLPLEKAIRRQLKKAPHTLVHFLWCDRDLAFLDLRGDTNLIGTFHHLPEQLDTIVQRPASLRRFAAIVIMSENQRPWFEEHGVDSERIHCIHHGIDIDRFFPDPARPQDPSSISFLAVGNTGRDFDLLAKTIRLARSHLRFTIIGPEHERPNFQDLANAEFKSGISDAELVYAYQTADYLIHFTKQATANNVILEALACGTPVVANTCGGVAEYLNNDCAHLLPEHVPPEHAAFHLATLDPSHQSYPLMRKAARTHAESLAWKHAAEATSDLYDRLAA